MRVALTDEGHFYHLILNRQDARNAMELFI
jgi:hypothetical protein